MLFSMVPSPFAQQLSTIWLHSALQSSVVFEDAARVSQTCADPNPPTCIEVSPNLNLIGFGETLMHAACASLQLKELPPLLHCGVAANAPDDASESKAIAVVMANCMVSGNRLSGCLIRVEECMF